MINIIYDLVNVIPVCMSAVLLVFGGGWPEDDRVLLYLVPALLGALFVAFRHMTPRLRIATAGIAAAFAGGVFFIAGSEGRSEIYDRYAYLVPVILLCLAGFLVQKAAGRYRKIKLVMALSGAVLLIVMMIIKTPVDRYCVALILFYAVMTVTEEIHLHTKKEGDIGFRAHLVHILPFPMLILIALLFFKAPEKPYDWGFVKAAIEKAKQGYELVLRTVGGNKGWDGDEAAIGFSDNGRIAGSVGGAPYEAMKVTTTTRYDGRLYLSGMSFDSFDGREWSKKDKDTDEKLGIDVLESAAAVMGYDPEHFSDYMKESEVRVDYTGVKTSRVFLPGKSLPDLAGNKMKETGGDLSFEGRSKAYSMRFYKLNRSYEGCAGLLGDAAPADIYGINKAAGQILPKGSKKYSEADLLSYRENVKKIYGQEAELSNEMRTYLDELLEGASSDAEKLSRIEKFLSSMKYDTDPGPIPDDVKSPGDFLDELLFHKKAGFCVHYATAFVLLARAEGIPARYVQGYSVVINGTAAPVMTDSAHAWPEAYIEGIGWIGYEPTPGFKKYTGWRIPDASESKGYVPDHDQGGDSVSGDGADAADGEEESATNLGFILVPLAAAFVFLLLFVFVDICLRRYRYGRLDDREKALNLGRRSLKALKRCGLSMKAGETLEEFMERAKESVPEGSLEHLLTYETLLYSDRGITPEEVSSMKEASDSLGRYAVKRTITGFFRIKNTR